MKRFITLTAVVALFATFSSRAQTPAAPDENRFTKTVLSNDLNEPMELAVAPDGRVFFVERAGKCYVYEPKTRKTRLLRDFPVKAVDKYLNGLLGMTIDPDYAHNHFLYFFYTIQDGEQTKQRIGRFTVADDGNLDEASEKAIIEFPIDLEVSAHTGGSMAWDTHRNLFISTGDNTVPFESDGFAPIDQRPGRLVYDAERSAGNPNDLRGKILRINVKPDGSYTIPEGNLFPVGTPQMRPEIYVMGCRNPYRISVDPATGIVYWGEIGPDSGVDGKQGPRGYDEFNQAKRAGNYGWPFFVGDSKPYHQYDFASKEIGPLFDPAAPVNNSPNNTGAKTLPPVQKAMVWYPYNKSDQFPELGVGGRCAMGGPVYHYDAQLASATKLPQYYDKALFMYDWMRNWVFAVRLDDQQNYVSMERFMPERGDFRRPVDMEVGPEGSIYMLEYGSVYGIDNVDARLVRIDFNPGNRAPVAQISAPDSVGTAPLSLAFSSAKSYDFDKNDQLRYVWNFGDGTTPATDANPTHVFKKNGIYHTVLTVTDPAGARSTDTLLVRVGNTRPQVAIRTSTNRTFFFPDQTPLAYAVTVKDREDGTVDPKNVRVALNYIPKVADNSQLVGHQTITGSYNLGKSLMLASDCKACHQIAGKSVGPAYVDVAKRYQNDPNAVARLANKVITGGGGTWGEHAMSAHPQLSRDDAVEIVKYVLSLANEQPDARLPLQGNRTLDEHLAKADAKPAGGRSAGQGRYVLTASYTDRGGALRTNPNGALNGQDVLVLRPARVRAGEADELHDMQKDGNRLGSIHNGSYFVLKNIDLTGIHKLTYRYASKDHGATLETHVGSPTGPLVGTLRYEPTGDWKKWTEQTVPVEPPAGSPTGPQDLYFVVRKDDKPDQHLLTLDWIEFGR